MSSALAPHARTQTRHGSFSFSFDRCCNRDVPLSYTYQTDFSDHNAQTCLATAKRLCTIIFCSEHACYMTSRGWKTTTRRSEQQKARKGLDCRTWAGFPTSSEQNCKTIPFPPLAITDSLKQHQSTKSILALLHIVYNPRDIGNTVNGNFRICLAKVQETISSSIRSRMR